MARLDLADAVRYRILTMRQKSGMEPLVACHGITARSMETVTGDVLPNFAQTLDVAKLTERRHLPGGWG